MKIWKGKEQEGTSQTKGRLTWFVESATVDGELLIAKLNELNETPTRLYLGAGRKDVLFWLNTKPLVDYIRRNNVEVIIETLPEFADVTPQEILDVAEIILAVRTCSEAVKKKIKFVKLDTYMTVYIQPVTHWCETSLSTLENNMFKGEDTLLYEDNNE